MRRILSGGALIVLAVLGTGCTGVDQSEEMTTRAETATTPAAPISTTLSTTTVSTTTTTSTTITTASPTTTAPTTTTLAVVGSLDTGLFCRDVAALGYNYTEAVVYWMKEGQPDRMDADHNGIPCETVYPPDEVIALWGDPLPTTTTVTAATPVSRYVVSHPGRFPDPLPGSDGAAGSGCAPGTTTLPDGIWFGYATARTIDGIQFDLACLFIDPTVDGGNRISNQNPTLRSIAVASGTTVHAVTWDPFYTPITYSEWIVWECLEYCGVWLYINEGIVTEVAEQFFA